MKLRALNIFISMFIAACCITSCLDSKVQDYVLSQNASITSFSIKDSIRTLYPAVVNGKDTTLEKWVVGSDYPFVINQLDGLIYNNDSLPVGTDVSKVVVNITADASGIFIVADTDTLWQAEDSLDFTKPIQFKILSFAGTFGRVYTTKINVHQQDPDSMAWTRIENNFPKDIKGQKALYANNRIYVFAEQGSQIVMTSTNVSDGQEWSEPVAIDIPTKADYTSVLEWGNRFYILADNQLYTSENGINWVEAGSSQGISQLLGAVHTESHQKITAIDLDNHYMESENGIEWNRYQEMPANFPKENLASVSYQLDTNSDISKFVLVGDNGSANDTILTPWTQLHTETEWTELEAASSNYACPKLEDMGMVKYNNSLYLFGGAGQLKEKIEPFRWFYISKDHGISWQVVKKKTLFPAEFATFYEQAEGNYSYIVDDNHFFWIMWSQTGEVWRGRINRLGFQKQ